MDSYRVYTPRAWSTRPAFRNTRAFPQRTSVSRTHRSSLVSGANRFLWNRGGPSRFHSVHALSAPKDVSSKLKVTVPCKVPFGTILKLVGSAEELGEWQVDEALALEWTEGDVWKLTLETAPAEAFEYKMVAMNTFDGSVRWETCENRPFEPAESDTEIELVWDQWDPIKQGPVETEEEEATTSAEQQEEASSTEEQGAAGSNELLMQEATVENVVDEEVDSGIADELVPEVKTEDSPINECSSVVEAGELASETVGEEVPNGVEDLFEQDEEEEFEQEAEENTELKNEEVNDVQMTNNDAVDDVIADSWTLDWEAAAKEVFSLNPKEPKEDKVSEKEEEKDEPVVSESETTSSEPEQATANDSTGEAESFVKLQFPWSAPPVIPVIPDAPTGQDIADEVTEKLDETVAKNDVAAPDVESSSSEVVAEETDKQEETTLEENPSTPQIETDMEEEDSSTPQIEEGENIEEAPMPVEMNESLAMFDSPVNGVEASDGAEEAVAELEELEVVEQDELPFDEVVADKDGSLLFTSELLSRDVPEEITEPIDSLAPAVEDSQEQEEEKQDKEVAVSSLVESSLDGTESSLDSGTRVITRPFGGNLTNTDDSKSGPLTPTLTAAALGVGTVVLGSFGMELADALIGGALLFVGSAAVFSREESLRRQRNGERDTKMQMQMVTKMMLMMLILIVMLMMLVLLMVPVLLLLL